ncbi:hypothetical protein TNCT_351381 [Trichonephila clavata]|uniref:Uncharacterized protein n=1 Tax=Trichonephila clavata TaxID=2740835 RepID=A0A8X6HF27_TRICU|nr:hypothetical protein TNCT_351381 [Trichonephila clavata]
MLRGSGQAQEREGTATIISFEISSFFPAAADPQVHELLVLTTCAFLAIRGAPSVSVAQAVSSALCSLKECLTIMVGEPVGLEELEEAAPLVERLARLADTFRRMALCMEEYVCLKVIIMQSSGTI